MITSLKENITKFLVLISMIFIETISIQSVAGQVGNGGGGVSRGGRPMTFYSAGIIVEPRGLTSTEIPEIGSLINFFNGNHIISDKVKSDLTLQIDPSSSRRYFRVKQDQFTGKVKDRIISEYNRISGVDANQITLFAITDIEQRITYLFPDFYRLSSLEKMAILYHEAYWILNPESSYDKIVEAEVAFQAYLENNTSFEYAYRWIAATQTKASLLYAAINMDLQSNVLNGFLIENRYIKARILLGDEFADCAKNWINKISFCLPLATSYLYRLKNQYPQSYLFRLIYESALNERLSFHLEHGYLSDLFEQQTDLDLKNSNISLGNAIFIMRENKNRVDSVAYIKIL